MSTEANSELLQLITPSPDPTLLLDRNRRKTLSGLLDTVPVEQALEILKVYYLKELSDEVHKVRVRAAEISEKLDRIAGQL